MSSALAIVLILLVVAGGLMLLGRRAFPDNDDS